ncbi:MAG: hypothetical protein WAW88_01310 [Nocardioides sp.]
MFSQRRQRLWILPILAPDEPPLDEAFWSRALSISPTDVPALDRTTVGDFWFDSTEGRMRLDAQMLHPLRLATDDAVWTRARESDSPGPEQTVALRELLRRGLRGQNGRRTAVSTVTRVLMVSSLPVAREYASWPRLYRYPTATALVATNSSHTVIAHEVGHVLGFAHPHGLVSDINGTLTTEYGSPYCVMGTARRHHEICTTLTRWPQPSELPDRSVFFAAAGPRLSRASLIAHRLLKPLSAWRRPPWLTRVKLHPGGALQLRLTDATGPAGLPRAALIRPPGRERYVVEVRRPRPDAAHVDWDARLDLRRLPESMRQHPDHDTHDSPGVVLHRLDPMPLRFLGSSLLPPFFRVAYRVTYVGSIPLPPGGDRDTGWGEPGLHVTLLADDGEVVEVGLAADQAAPKAEICTLAATSKPKGGATVLVHGHVYGVAAQEIRWRIGGIDLPFLGVGEAHRQKLVVPLSVADPHGGTVRRGIKVVAWARWDELELQVSRERGRFTLPIGLIGPGGTATSEKRMTFPLSPDAD